MKRRTKNFVEDILIIIGVLFILYLIYFFVFSKDNDLSFETATKETKVEMETKDSKVFVSENGFLSQIYEDIKNKLFADNNELLTIKKVEEENKEDNTKNIYLSQRAEILSKQEERVKEDLNTQQEQTTKNEENISTENRNIEALKQEEIKDKVVENVVEQRVENKLATEQKNEEPVQQIKDNDHKDETILLEPKTTLETKTLEDVKTDENSEEVHHEVSNIDDFFDRFEKKVYSNIDRNFDKTTFKRGEFVNIRVTILKDGSYEQLTFLNGNSDYFNKVKPQIEEIFPLKIEENLKSHFPSFFNYLNSIPYFSKRLTQTILFPSLSNSAGVPCTFKLIPKFICSSSFFSSFSNSFLEYFAFFTLLKLSPILNSNIALIFSSLVFLLIMYILKSFAFS